MPGQKLLQEFLTSGQLGDAPRKLVHALLEVPLRPGRPSCAIQQPILEPCQTTPIAPPGHTQDNHTGDRGAKQTEKDALIHGSCPVGERSNVRAIPFRVSGTRGTQGSWVPKCNDFHQKGMPPTNSAGRMVRHPCHT